MAKYRLTIRTPAANSTYKKLAVQWLKETLCFVSSFVVADSLVLRNRQLLVAAKRCVQLTKTTLTNRQKNRHMAIFGDSLAMSLIDKYVKPLFTVNDKRTDSQKFLDVLEHINKKKSPLFISEKLCGVLEERFIEVHKKMQGNEEDYYNLLIQIVQSIENNFDETVSVWKDRLIYFRSIKEVWVACEPLLDLIDNEEGSFDLLERQLKHVEKITYFLTSKTYFDDLIIILKNRNFDDTKIQKLHCKIIPQKLIHPVVIYIGENNNYHGMAGKSHPDIAKRSNEYYFRNNLPPNWLYYLSKDRIQTHYDKLTNQL